MLGLVKGLVESWDSMVTEVCRAFTATLERRESLMTRQERLMTRQEHLQTRREAAWAVHHGHDEEVNNEPPTQKH
jgi:hypothetical protein